MWVAGCFEQGMTTVGEAKYPRLLCLLLAASRVLLGNSHHSGAGYITKWSTDNLFICFIFTAYQQHRVTDIHVIDLV